MLEFDVDNDGMLDFEEFKLAIKFAQSKMKNRDRNEDGEFWGPEKMSKVFCTRLLKIYFKLEMLNVTAGILALGGGNVEWQTCEKCNQL